ncbi:MAG: ATP-binding cassette domain-containing protein, partial [Thermaerobacter sp.]|nr:ATP-binding cassette domain-containing protein [Thermaerobacter sp.]
ARRSPFALSGGERRRAALAGVLAMEPELVCLDEPTAGLDWRGCGEVLELLARLNREEGVGVVLVTHRMEEALRFAHRVALLRSGRLVLAGDPETVLARPDLLRRCGLEVPPVVRVQELLIRRGLALASPALDAAAAAQRILRALEVG